MKFNLISIALDRPNLLDLGQWPHAVVTFLNWFEVSDLPEDNVEDILMGFMADPSLDWIGVTLIGSYEDCGDRNVRMRRAADFDALAAWPFAAGLSFS